MTKKSSGLSNVRSNDLLDVEIDSYMKTAKAKFYNQEWFQQFKMNDDDGIFKFIYNGSEFIPFEEFKDDI